MIWRWRSQNIILVIENLNFWSQNSTSHRKSIKYHHSIIHSYRKHDNFSSKLDQNYQKQLACTRIYPVVPYRPLLYQFTNCLFLSLNRLSVKINLHPKPTKPFQVCTGSILEIYPFESILFQKYQFKNIKESPPLQKSRTDELRIPCPFRL